MESFIQKNERRGEVSSKQSVTNCNRLGNVAKMREALEQADVLISIATFEEGVKMDEVDKIRSKINAALSAPPRNCDVGTAEEQNNRFKRFCDSKSMGYCWGRGCRKCMAQWGQMPYEEGGAK